MCFMSVSAVHFSIFTGAQFIMPIIRGGKIFYAYTILVTLDVVLPIRFFFL